ALHREVKPRWRAVHLERRPGPGSFAVDQVPVEIEVVALTDLAPGWMSDDVDMRTADRVERPLRQLRARLAAPDMDGRHDQVEPRQQIILVVELPVGTDLQLAAVEEAKALCRRLRRRGAGGLLLRVSSVERGDDLGLLCHAI